MRFEEINLPTIKNLFVSQMENKILEGLLVVGEKLPNEREMAEQLNISRSMVNIGLKELADKGFIRVEARKGAYVEDYIKNGNIRTLIAIIQNRGAYYDPRLLRSFIEFRNELEILSAKAAAGRRTAENLTNMRRSINAIQEAGNESNVMDAATDFHREIFIASGNMVYPLLYNSFEDLIHIVGQVLYKLLGRNKLVERFLLMLAALENRDEEEAEYLARSHVSECSDMLFEYYKITP